MFTLVLLISAVWLQAQDAGQTMGKSDLMTVQGCLQVSNGRYSLTESNGDVHQLTGAATKLSKHIGHEVEITGTPRTRAASTTQQGTASTAHVVPAIGVKTIKHIADTCTAK
jgi:hypothetical protein